MTCSCSVRRSSFDRPTGNRVEVTGTWDFKWPAGKKLRVAFQQPRSEEVTRDDFRTAKKAIESLASLWTKGKRAADIGFEWTSIELEPADDTDPLNGSPFTLPKDSEAYRATDYDILVSVDQLPRGRRDPLTLDSLEKIFLPTSELGSFCRRLDYGVPTMYIGPFAGSRFTLGEYYSRSKLGAFYVVHEFGHALGLAHAHQNPERRALSFDAAQQEFVQRVHELMTIVRNERAKAANPAYTDPAARKALRALIDPIKTRLLDFLNTHRIPVTVEEAALDDFVVSQIVEDWPGNTAFSDWMPDTRPSIMEAPSFGCLMGMHGLTKGFCEACTSLINAQVPTELDYQQLAEMYPKV